MSIESAGLAAEVDHQRIWDLGYELLELSRSDEHCDIWQIRHRQTYDLFAWQQLRPEWEASVRGRSALENEVAVGQLISSPLFLRLKLAHVSERPRFAIWEWFEAVTAEQLLHDYVRLPISAALWIVRQCAEGLDALLRAGLTHGDVRLSNILVNPTSGLVKLTGLGGSRRVAQGMGLDSGHRAKAAGPAVDYEAVAVPTRLRGEARDLYGLGSILFQTLTARIPYEAETPAELLRGRQVNLAEDLLRMRPDVPPGLAALVRDLLIPEASRPIRHPATLVNRLNEFELAELAKLDTQRAR